MELNRCFSGLGRNWVEDRSSQSRPCAKISTMSDNRSSVVNLSRRIALAPRTRRQSRPHGAHRGGLGQVNSAGRDVAEYNLERKHTSSTSSAGLPTRRAVDTYPCDALWLGPSWPCTSLDRYTQSTLNVARHAKKSEVEGEIESQIESQEAQEGQTSSAALSGGRLLSAFRRWRLLQRKQPTSPRSTKPPQRSQKAPRSNVVLTQ